jgi:hypothetical protein
VLDRVDAATARAVLAVWRKIDGDNLPPWEQSVVIKQMAELMKAPPSHTQDRRFDVRDIVRLQETLEDE